MANKIQVKRGAKASLPALNEGEFGFCTDSKELYIGNTGGNVLVNVPEKCVTATGDWNNYQQTGFYMGSSLTNAPPATNGSHTWWYVIVMQHNTSPGWILQIATDLYNKATYKRVKNSGVWESWVLNPDTSTIKAGTVTTGAAGTNASVSTNVDSSGIKFNFTIPKGDTGAQGVQGVTGAAGTAATITVGTVTTGAAGTQAAVSNSGTSSAAKFDFTIPKGDTGATGAQGSKGDTGATGVQGPKGDTGPAGAQGPKGDTGAPGSQGIQGLKGDTGAPGPQGIQGLKGDTGAPGAQGPKGDTGATGPQGPKGDTGATGSQGPKGDTGATGPQGATGAPGADAYTVVLSSESYTFPAGTSAALAGSATCNVIAFKGGTQAAATIGTISGQVTGMSTSITSNGTTSAYFTITVTTSLTTRNGILTIPITVDGKSFTKRFSWSLAATGVNLTAYNLSGDVLGTYICNGGDDSGQIQRALNLLPSNGGTLVFGASRFILDKSVYITKPNVTLQGTFGGKLWSCNKVYIYFSFYNTYFLGLRIEGLLAKVMRANTFNLATYFGLSKMEIEESVQYTSSEDGADSTIVSDIDTDSLNSESVDTIPAVSLLSAGINTMSTAGLDTVDESVTEEAPKKIRPAGFVIENCEFINGGLKLWGRLFNAFIKNNTFSDCEVAIEGRDLRESVICNNTIKGCKTGMIFKNPKNIAIEDNFITTTDTEDKVIMLKSADNVKVHSNYCRRGIIEINGCKHSSFRDNNYLSGSEIAFMPLYDSDDNEGL